MTRFQIEGGGLVQGVTKFTTYSIFSHGDQKIIMEVEFTLNLVDFFKKYFCSMYLREKLSFFLNAKGLIFIFILTQENIKVFGEKTRYFL